MIPLEIEAKMKDSDPDIKIESNAEPNVETNIETNIETSIETNIETNRETNVEPNVETNVETNIETNRETNVEPNVETNVETNIETNIESNADPNVESNVESNVYPYVESNVDRVPFLGEENKIYANEEDENFVNNYINENIINLKSVDNYLEKMDNKIKELDENINDRVQKYILMKNEYEKVFKSIKERTKLINNIINDIDKKTEKNEDALIILCKDIKKLDTGKQNVTQTIILLKRIVILITSISKLKKKAIKREYKDCIYLIHIIKEMLTHFSDLKTNNKLRNLYHETKILFKDLKNQIKEDINLIYDPHILIEKNMVILNDHLIPIEKNNHDSINNNNNNNNNNNHNNNHNNNNHNNHNHNNNHHSYIRINLFDACTCLYYLNSSLIKKVSKKFTNFFLEKFIFIFKNQAHTLDSIDRRISWIKRALNNYDNVYSHIFPSIYNIPFHIVTKFCLITQKHVLKILSSSIEHTNNPTDLIKTVINVINFENFLNKNIKYYSSNEIPTIHDYSSLDLPFPELLIQKSLPKKEKENMNTDLSSIKNKNYINNEDHQKELNISVDNHNEFSEQMKFLDKKKNTQLINNYLYMEDITSNQDENNIIFTYNNNMMINTFQSVQNFKGAISCSFDSFLCNWLKYEEKKILNKFENIINEKKEDYISDIKNYKCIKDIVNIDFNNFDINEINNINLDTSNNTYYYNNRDIKIIEQNIYNNVYKSSYSIFHLYKNYINMILLFSKCQTLYDFILFFKTLLFKYSEELNKRIIEKIQESQEIEHIKLLSILINTCSYINSQMNEAYQQLKTNMDPSYFIYISFKDEEKYFLNIKTKCIKNIILYIKEKINNIISNITIVNIYDINNICEKSIYMNNIKKLLYQYFSFFKNIFDNTCLTYLLEKTTTLIIQQFYDTIFSFTYITNITAQQLLLDSYEMQKVLFSMTDILNSTNQNKQKSQKIHQHKKYDELKNENIETIHNITSKENKTNKNLLPLEEINLLSESHINIEYSEDETIIPQTYYNYVTSRLNKIQFLLKIFLSNIYDINAFNLLLTENDNICNIEEIEKILTMKYEKDKYLEEDNKINKDYMLDIKKTGIRAAEELKNFISKMTHL
ncbi:vacuolar protein sorting-associated protein 53, putative [Plasmodium sp. gorilla clade G2]|uniref:vacuolar protein sorting-associated protein 53, putative n=1 Tax=Plasmodium sp. gorilla clade G2 TaxID=880535 RepID=UPI000D2194BE|nr:vacuolar protein sorting-associated protein 53, putative [Plasmodium sp. gorilla clade G2]SOV13219.1 vacuolar protein sorting-associated protein 53, putative [Plasmodium sp. gorilla clade G2]